jgi:transcriptional regulator with XRE-family HTH domain
MDVANTAGVSAGLVSLIERGHIGAVSLSALRRVAAVLDIRIDVLARWRGGELDRLLNARHSALQDAIARWLGRPGGWTVAPEVSFAIYGERGWVDLLAWHVETATLLVIEIKTELVDLQELIGVVDRKVRLAPRIGRDRGWTPKAVASWVIVAEGATNRRRVAAHSGLLRAAFPADGRAMRHWLRQPVGRVGALSFFSFSNGGSAKRDFAGRQRVRRPAGTAD